MLGRLKLGCRTVGDREELPVLRPRPPTRAPLELGRRKTPVRLEEDVDPRFTPRVGCGFARGRLITELLDGERGTVRVIVGAPPDRPTAGARCVLDGGRLTTPVRVGAEPLLPVVRTRAGVVRTIGPVRPAGARLTVPVRLSDGRVTVPVRLAGTRLTVPVRADGERLTGPVRVAGARLTVPVRLIGRRFTVPVRLAGTLPTAPVRVGGRRVAVGTRWLGTRAVGRRAAGCATVRRYGTPLRTGTARYPR